MIIGVTGWFASGKDTVCEYLEKKGFKKISLSDIIREYLAKEDLEPTRDNLRKAGNQLREKFGSNYLAKEALQRIEKDHKHNNFVIPSVRLPAETKTLRESPDFQLWEVYVPAKIRYQRLKKRARTADEKNLTFTDFLQKESAEKSDDPNHQQLDKVIQMADARNAKVH